MCRSASRIARDRLIIILEVLFLTSPRPPKKKKKKKNILPKKILNIKVSKDK
jgi:hypothetical protein